MCMVPFPDDFYTRADSSSATGRRIDFKTAAMPVNDTGVHMAGDPHNLNDGFSPGQSIVVRIPGPEHAGGPRRQHASSARAARELAAEADTSFVVIDADSGSGT